MHSWRTGHSRGCPRVDLVADRERQVSGSARRSVPRIGEASARGRPSAYTNSSTVFKLGRTLRAILELFTAAKACCSPQRPAGSTASGFPASTSEHATSTRMVRPLPSNVPWSWLGCTAKPASRSRSCTPAWGLGVRARSLTTCGRAVFALSQWSACSSKASTCPACASSPTTTNTNHCRRPRRSSADSPASSSTTREPRTWPTTTTPGSSATHHPTCPWRPYSHCAGRSSTERAPQPGRIGLDLNDLALADRYAPSLDGFRRLRLLNGSDTACEDRRS